MLDELNSCASVVQFLIQNSGISLQGCFISFVDPHLLGYVAELALLQGRPEPFFRLAAAHAFMHTYINRVDRSLFFLLYEDPQFLAIE